MQKYRKVIYLAGFLFSIPVALTSYINSSLLETFTTPAIVSAVYVIGSILTILNLLRMPAILAKFGNRKTTIAYSILIFVAMLALAFGKSSILVISAFILYFLASHMIITTLDIFMEDASGEKNIGKMRGIYLTFVNLAWVVAQLVSGSIIAKSSFKGIYILASLFVILTAIVIAMFFKKWHDPEYKKVVVWKTLLFFIRNKNISKIYLINLILRFFFAWMIIYTPIYLHGHIGFDWGQIGIIFTIMLLPFVLLTYPLGRKSDKIGEKKMLMLGFIICAFATVSIPLLATPNVFYWALLLFMTRVGAATIEIMSESYFFKLVTEEHADEISFFRNTAPVSFLVAPIFAVIVLTLTPSFSFIYLVLGALLLFGAYLSLKLKDIK